MKSIIGGTIMSNEIKGLGSWNGSIFSIKAIEKQQYNSTKIKCPDYEYDEVLDKEKMYLNMIYSDEIYIDVIRLEYLVIADKSGYISIVRLNEIAEEDSEWIKKIISSTSSKLFRSGKEVLKFLRNKNISIGGKYFDIMLASELLEFGTIELKDTADIVDKYLPNDRFYTVNDTNKTNTIINNCKVMFGLGNVLKDKLEKSEMEDIAKVEFRCLDAVVEMETIGIFFDEKLWKKTKNNRRQTTDYSKDVDFKTSRIYSTFNQMGSVTGRITSSMPNVQNISRDQEIRSSFKADEKNIIMIGDYSQMELRIVAEVANDLVMIDAFKSKIDLHSFMASKILNKNIQSLTIDDRHAGKTINFGLIYGMGADSLIKYAKYRFNLDISGSEATRFIKVFFSTYPAIKIWHNSAYKSKAQGVRTMGGRVRKWSKAPKMQLLLNSKVQGTTSDIIKNALGYLIELRTFYNLRFNIVNVVHDEIILEVYNQEENIKKTKEVLNEAMIKAGKCYLKKTPVEVSIVIGKDWSAK